MSSSYTAVASPFNHCLPASFTSSLFLKRLPSKNSFSVGNKWKTLGPKSELCWMTCASAVRRWFSLSGRPSYYSRNFANEIMAGKVSWTERVACVWEVRKSYRLVRKCDEIRPRWRSRRRWEGNIRHYVIFGNGLSVFV